MQHASSKCNTALYPYRLFPRMYVDVTVHSNIFATLYIYAMEPTLIDTNIALQAIGTVLGRLRLLHMLIYRVKVSLLSICLQEIVEV